MLKSDLINILVVKRGVTQKQAELTIETIFESMKDALCKGENIEIRGLGAFHVKHYEGYQGRNPKTGDVIPVKPKRGILFRTGKELRDRVNRPEDASATGPATGEPGGARRRPVRERRAVAVVARPPARHRAVDARPTGITRRSVGSSS
jgi:integration host factor subunit beta